MADGVLQSLHLVILYVAVKCVVENTFEWKGPFSQHGQFHAFESINIK